MQAKEMRRRSSKRREMDVEYEEKKASLSLTQVTVVTVIIVTVEYEEKKASLSLTQVTVVTVVIVTIVTVVTVTIVTVNSDSGV